jgi:integrase
MTRYRRSFGSLRQLPSGRFQAHYTDPRNGARIKAPNTFAGRNAAERWLADRRRDIDAGFPPQRRRARQMFADYARTWLANRVASGRPLKARTRDHYTMILDQHLLPTFGPKPLAAITPQDVRDWHARTLTDAPTLRAHAYTLLKSILNSAIADELIDANPCRITGAGRSTRIHRIRPASITELGALTQAMPERLRLLVLLASWCAMRFGEIIELRRHDVDLVDEVIRIRRAAYRVKGGYVAGTPKSDAGIRDVAIPPHLLPVISDHLDRFVGPEPDTLLFVGANAGRLAISTLQHHWQRARETVGRPDLRFHDLRHTGAVLAAATGASLAELMARLGHSTPQAAMRYQHAAAGRDREIAALLSKLAQA